MICVVATIQVREHKAAEFESVALELEARVNADEPGCLLYRMTKSRTEPNTYKNLEIFRDQTALDQHTSADYFLTAVGKLGACLDGNPQVEFLDTLE